MSKPTWPPTVSPPARPFVRQPVQRIDPPQARADIDDAVAAENEQRRLERALARLTRKLDELEKQVDLTTPRNRRYNVNFNIDPNGETSAMTDFVTTRSVVVNKGQRFYAMALESHFKIQSGGATFALGPAVMREFFDFEWRIRDTGSDREWSNDWLPSDFLYSGDMCGLLTPEAPALLGGNASIEVDIKVTRFAGGSGTGTLFETIEKYLLQVSFVGVEVPE